MGSEVDRPDLGMRPVIPFRPRSSFCVSGSTGSGKTTWIRKLIRYRDVMFGDEDPPQRVIYCYGVYDAELREIEQDSRGDTQLIQGLPVDVTFSADTHTLLILDDLSSQVLANDDMLTIFTQGCHHSGITCLFVQ